MFGPWRAIALAAVLALGAATTAIAQTIDPKPVPAAPAAPPPPAAPQAQSPDQSNDPFGEALTLAPKTVIYLKGNSTWDKALETLIDSFKSVYAYLDKQGLKRAGPPMTIYIQADDTGFQVHAAVPVEAEPKDPPKGDIAAGKSPGGKALKFVHRGSYDSMDNIYEAITNHLELKGLEAQDVFVEEYQTDPVTTPEDKFVITVYVPIK
jgi:effector-binding domain-containing protein